MVRLSHRWHPRRLSPPAEPRVESPRSRSKRGRRPVAAWRRSGDRRLPAVFAAPPSGSIRKGPPAGTTTGCGFCPP